MEPTFVSRRLLKRLPIYLDHLRSLPEESVTISATTIANAVGLGHVQVRKDLAREYALKADPDVQGITFNLGDLSERVQKIDDQLTRIKERDPDMADKLCEKVTAAMRQILGAVKWNPWKEQGEPVATSEA